MNTPHNKSTLVLRLGALGDATLCTGVLEYWHKRFGLTFHVLTKSALKPIFSGSSAVESVITLHPEELTSRAWLLKCIELRTIYGKLPLIDLHGNTRSRMLRALWPSSVYASPKYGLLRRIFRQLHNPELGHFLRATNIPQRYALALQASPPHPSLVRPKVHLTQNEKQQAKRILTLKKLKTPIALHPYSTHTEKTPPTSFWRSLYTGLHATGHDVLILGAHHAPLYPDAPNDLTNSTDLRTTAAILEQCQLLVTGDSGPMHLSTAVRTPVFALFGPTTKEWGFYPSGQNDSVLQVFCPFAPCSLHGQKGCQQPKTCLESLSSTDVLRAIHAKLPKPALDEYQTR